MRTKDLEKMIKSESKKVDIPNVSVNILDKLNELEKPIVLMKERRQPRHLRLAFTLSFSLLLTLFLGFGSFRVATVDPIDDDSIAEAIVLSTVTSSELAIDSLSYDDEIILLANGFGQNNDEEDDTEIIETEVDHLSKYLGVIEQMIETNQQVNVRRQRMNLVSRRYRLTFETSNLDDEQTSYALNYETVERDNGIYRLSGEIVRNDASYQMEITYDRTEKTITSKTFKEASRYVLVQYHRSDDENYYQVETYNDDVLEESVLISHNANREINLEFTNSQASGSYSFKLSTGVLNRRFLDIDYDINGHQGNIKVKVSMDDPNTYDIEVTPSQGQAVNFVRNRGRR